MIKITVIWVAIVISFSGGNDYPAFHLAWVIPFVDNINHYYLVQSLLCINFLTFIVCLKYANFCDVVT